MGKDNCLEFPQLHVSIHIARQFSSNAIISLQTSKPQDVLDMSKGMFSTEWMNWMNQLNGLLSAGDRRIRKIDRHRASTWSNWRCKGASLIAFRSWILQRNNGRLSKGRCPETNRAVDKRKLIFQLGHLGRCDSLPSLDRVELPSRVLG